MVRDIVEEVEAKIAPRTELQRTHIAVVPSKRVIIGLYKFGFGWDVCAVKGYSKSRLVSFWRYPKAKAYFDMLVDKYGAQEMGRLNE